MTQPRTSDSPALVAARERRAANVPRMAVSDPIAEKWAAVTETVRWIIADDALADRLLVALANLAPASVEITR